MGAGPGRPGPVNPPRLKLMIGIVCVWVDGSGPSMRQRWKDFSTVSEKQPVDALRKMRGQRRDHQVGDWFVLQLESDGSYRAGRIVKMGEPTREARFPGGILVYIYRPELDEMPRTTPDFGPSQLLLPPFFTANWMWSKGYFRTFDHSQLDQADLLAHPCFYSAYHDWYVDDNDRLIDERVEPCGWFSLANFETVSEDIANAVNGRTVTARHGQRKP